VLDTGLPGQRLAWSAGVAIAVGYAGGHLVLARGPLEPLERAARTNRDYVTGTYAPERLPQGQFRWTGSTRRSPRRTVAIPRHPVPHRAP
jgi:hypothetical protein